jgi:hypothetical protein
MTLDDWLAAKSPGSLSSEISALSDRKIHLLTAAFLRRVWDRLLSHHAQIAVEGTEKFADGRVTKVALARLRVDDARETSHPLWFATHPNWPAESWLGELSYWGNDAYAVNEQRTVERERRIANFGHVLPCVKAGIDWPHWVAAKAAFLARELRAWSAPADKRETVAVREERAQFALFREIGGDGSRPDARWPRWRTLDVLALARGIHRDQAFNRLPILADALQDAGCDDGDVLRHCREGTGHVRGCWVVDLALGVL